MLSHIASSRRRLAALAATVVLAVSIAGCGSDSSSDGPEVPEGGTGSAYNDAIIASDSHDEVLLGGGTGAMVVAVQCLGEANVAVVTVVADGAEPGLFTGVFEPSTGVDLMIDITSADQITGASQMSLDAEEYTVTFADLDDAEFTVSGCPT